MLLSLISLSWKGAVHQRWRRGHNLQGQGQGLWKSPRPRPRTELPRTGCLEAKAKDSRTRFENTRKYKCKHCHYHFTSIQA